MQPTIMSSAAEWAIPINGGTGIAIATDQQVGIGLYTLVPNPNATAATTATVSKAVTLGGITPAQFGTTERNAFKASIADNVGTVCGDSAGTRPCTAGDVHFVSVARRSVTVQYTLTVAPVSQAAAGATLDTYTASPQFATDLRAAGVSGVTSTSIPVASKSKAQKKSFPGIIIAAAVAVVVIVAISAAYCAFCRSSDADSNFNKMEDAGDVDGGQSL